MLTRYLVSVRRTTNTTNCDHDADANAGCAVIDKNESVAPEPASHRLSPN